MKWVFVNLIGGTDFVQLVGTAPDICIEGIFYPNKQVQAASINQAKFYIYGLESREGRGEDSNVGGEG
jgi:hypothetical protein